MPMQQYRARRRANLWLFNCSFATFVLATRNGLFAQQRLRRQTHTRESVELRNSTVRSQLLLWYQKVAGRQWDWPSITLSHTHTHTQCNENSRAQIAAMQSCALRLNNNCSLCIWEKIAAPNFIHGAHITTDRVAHYWILIDCTKNAQKIIVLSEFT